MAPGLSGRHRDAEVTHYSGRMMLQGPGTVCVFVGFQYSPGDAKADVVSKEKLHAMYKVAFK